MDDFFGLAGTNRRIEFRNVRLFRLDEAGLIAFLRTEVESLFDQTGTIGKWMAQQKAVQTFLELPPELQDFVSRPINRPYLELALKLSDMSADKLRAIAETLLDITF